MVKQTDILNSLVEQGRLRHVSVSAYIINKVSPDKFLKPNVEICENVSFAQARILTVSFGKEDTLTEGIIYVAVPDTVHVGEFYTLEGTLAPLSRDEYSREVSLFKFLKRNSLWFIDSVKAKPLDVSKFQDEEIIGNLNIWLDYPMTLSTVSSDVLPMTRMLESEVRYSLDASLINPYYELEKVNLPIDASLTQIQKQVLSEILAYPIIQLSVETASFTKLSVLISELKMHLGEGLHILDIRTKPFDTSAVYKTLKEQGKVKEGLKDRFIVVTNKPILGIPSIQIGQECLI